MTEHPRVRRPRLTLASRSWVAAALLGTALLLSSLVPAAGGAPAPAYRGATLRQRLTRGWSVRWSAPLYGYGCYPPPAPESGTARLFASGSWACHRGGLQYLGEWSLEGRTLTVTEECEEEPWRSGRSWRVELEDDGAGFEGEFDGGGRLALRP